MRCRPAAVAALLALALAAPAAGGELRVTVNPTEADEVPPGSREDQLLWKAARDATTAGMKNILDANSELVELRAALQHAAALQQAAPPAEREALAATARRLEGHRAELAAAIPTGPTGGCRYTLLHLEQSMDAEPGTALARRLPEKRKEARWCADAFGGANARLEPAIAATRATLDAVVPELRRRAAALPAPAPAPAQAAR